MASANNDQSMLFLSLNIVFVFFITFNLQRANCVRFMGTEIALLGIHQYEKRSEYF